MKAFVNQTVLASSTTVSGGNVVLDQTVSLAPWESAGMFDVRFEARDSAGTVVTRSVPVHVDSSYALVHVDDVGGPILDVDAMRILFLGPTGIAIKNRSTGAISVIAPTLPTAAFLTPVGATWRGGEVASGVYAPNARLAVIASGLWGAWSDASGVSRIDYTSGVTESVGDKARLLDLDGTGAVAYFEDATPLHDGTVYVDRAGVRTTISNVMGTSDVPGVQIVGDAVLLESTGGGGASHASFVSLYGPGDAGETPLGEVAGFNTEQVVVNGAWSAFPRSQGGAYSGSPPEVWSRSPAGTVSLACPFPNASPVAINTAGEVAYSMEGGRFVGSAGSSIPTKPIFVNDSQGTMRFLDGEWHVMIGRELFRLDRSARPPPDAGVGDGGSPPPAAGAGSDASDPAPSGSDGDAGGCAVTSSSTNGLGSALAALAGALAAVLAMRSRTRRSPRTK